jgi:hypothetical protein
VWQRISAFAPFTAFAAKRRSTGYFEKENV